MKSVLLVLVFAVASVASASTIAVTGGGLIGSLHFYLGGDDFGVSYGAHTVDDHIMCQVGSPCDLSGMSLVGYTPFGPGESFFEGQYGFVQGVASITAAPIVFMSDWQSDPNFTPAEPAVVTAHLNGLQIPFYPSLDGSYPFFSASVSSSQATAILNGCRNSLPGIVECYNESFQFSGTAEVTAISASEVPEPSPLLLMAGGLAFLIVHGRWRFTYCVSIGSILRRTPFSRHG
jgi:hypothetical protein